MDLNDDMWIDEPIPDKPTRSFKVKARIGQVQHIKVSRPLSGTPDDDLIEQTPSIYGFTEPVSSFDDTSLAERARVFLGNARMYTRKSIEAAQTAYRNWIKFYLLAEEIKARELYKQANLNWTDYCSQVLGVTASRVRQLRKAYPYVQALATAGMNDLTENDIRRLPSHIKPDDPRLLEIVQTAREGMKRFLGSDAAPTAAMYNAVLTVMETVRATGGYVDLGDGQMTALDAAVSQELTEAIMRKMSAAWDYQERHSRWETLDKRVWKFNEPGTLGIAVAAGVAVQDGDEIVVIVRRVKVDE